MRGIWFLIFFVFFMTACFNEQPLPSSNTSPEGNISEPVQQENVATADRRSIWQQPEVVMASLGDISNKVIADLGAGTGYFTFRLIPHVQKVIAIDIDQAALEYIDSTATFLPELYRNHLETRQADPDNAHIAKDEADVILIVNTYTYLPDRINYMRGLLEVLPDDGEVLIIDFKKKEIPIGPPANERIALYVLEQELREAGFTDVRSDDQTLNYQYIVHAHK